MKNKNLLIAATGIGIGSLILLAISNSKASDDTTSDDTTNDYIVGDVDGDGMVTLEDVDHVNRIVLGLNRPDGTSYPNDWIKRADANGDGYVNMGDYAIIEAILNNSESLYDYEIINPRYDLDGMYFTFKNNNVPNTDYEGDHQDLPVYFRPMPVVLYDNPWYDWEGDLYNMSFLYKYNTNPILLPLIGTSQSYHISFGDSLRNAITDGYVNQDSQQVFFYGEGFKFDNLVDIPEYPWYQRNIRPTHAPFPEIYRI
jgi:hypothetical protein